MRSPQGVDLILPKARECPRCIPPQQSARSHRCVVILLGSGMGLSAASSLVMFRHPGVPRQRRGCADSRARSGIDTLAKAQLRQINGRFDQCSSLALDFCSISSLPNIHTHWELCEHTPRVAHAHAHTHARHVEPLTQARYSAAIARLHAYS